mmetsp:Transcript_51142/g.100481  ORF Transcript_51142/g.100481 Transcript_51142/m.100481 type:complete len:143 (+) Transcript_51142:465-893(+)
MHDFTWAVEKSFLLFVCLVRFVPPPHTYIQCACVLSDRPASSLVVNMDPPTRHGTACPSRSDQNESRGIGARPGSLRPAKSLKGAFLCACACMHVRREGVIEGGNAKKFVCLCVRLYVCECVRERIFSASAWVKRVKKTKKS